VDTKTRVPTPGGVAKYLDDAGYEHEDFMNTSAVTLRARVSTTDPCVTISLSPSAQMWCYMDHLVSYKERLRSTLQ